VIIVEVAFRGVEGLSDSRLPFKNGLNVVRLQDPAQRAAVLDALYFPLFPDPSRATATAHLAQQPNSRVVLTLYGRDKKAYRLNRDLGTGSTKLYGYEEASKQYQLLTEVTQEAAQYVRVQQRLPDEVSFERLFLVDAASMPSRGARARTRSGTPVVGAGGSQWGAEPSFAGPPFGGRTPFAGTGPTPALGTPFAGLTDSGLGAAPRMPSALQGGEPGGFGSSVNMLNALVRSEIEGEAPPPVDVRRERLEELAKLKEHLEITASAEAAQDELDALTQRKLQLEDRASRLQQVVGRRTELEREVAQLPDLSGLSDNLREKIEDFDGAEERYRSERARLDIERTSTDELLLSSEIKPLPQEPLFLGGLGFAVVAILGAIVFAMPALAWLNVLGVVVSAGVALRFIHSHETRARLESRARSVQDRVDRLEKQYDLDTAVVRRTMERMEVEDPRELLTQVEEFNRLQAQLSEVRAEEATLRANPDIVGAADELRTVDAQIRSLEAQVLRNTGTLSSSKSLQRRIAQLEQELQRSGVDPRTAPPRGATPIIRGTEDIPPLRTVSDDDDSEDDGFSYDDGYDSSGPSGGSGGSQLGPASDGGMWCGSSGFPMGGGGAGSYGGGGYGGPGGPAPDRSRELMQSGVDLMQTTLDTFAPAFRDRFKEYLSALTDQRYVDCTFGPQGEVGVLDRDQQPTAYVALEGEVLDLVDVALRFALAEAVVSRVRIPIAVDDPFEAFPARRRTLFLQMLEYMSKLTQVVVLTSRDDVRGNVSEFQPAR
jgi:hypothetical protein